MTRREPLAPDGTPPFRRHIVPWPGRALLDSNKINELVENLPAFAP